MHINKFAASVFGLLAGVVLLGAGNVKADTNPLGFTAQPVDSVYQQVGYFKFNTTPNQITTLRVALKNTTKESEVIDATIQNGLSNPNGSTWYTNVTSAKDTQLLDINRAATKYITGPAKISLGANEQKIVTYTFKGPANINSGTILGGLSFEKENNQHKASTNTGIVVYTQVAERLSIEADYTNQPTAKIELGDSAELNINPTSPYVTVGITNAEPVIAKDIQINYKVYNSDKSKLLFSKSTDAAQSTIMAPSTSINYHIPWTANQFKAGNYKIEFNLKTGTQNLNKEYDIQVKNTSVSHFSKISNEKKVVVHQTSTVVKVLIAGLSVAVAALLFVVFKRHKKDETDKKEN